MPENRYKKLEEKINESEIKRTIEITNNDRVKNLENQLQWYKWEERTINRDKSSMNESLFHSLQISFNRAAGIGARRGGFADYTGRQGSFAARV